MKRCWPVGMLISLIAMFQVMAGGAGKQAQETKEALQALQDYIGSWKGNGTSEKNKSEIWNEKVAWSWRFKGQDAWLTLDFSQSRVFKNGEIRYLPDKKVYELTLLDKKDNKQILRGKLTGPKKDKLVLERQDAETKETHQLALNMAAGGIGSVYTYSTKPENRTIYTRQWQLRFTKEGESFATAKKQVECVVTGGLGTMPVSYKGVTYYVCCSGCRDAFNENPEKIIKEYQARKKAGN